MKQKLKYISACILVIFFIISTTFFPGCINTYFDKILGHADNEIISQVSGDSIYSKDTAVSESRIGGSLDTDSTRDNNSFDGNINNSDLLYSQEGNKTPDSNPYTDFRTSQESKRILLNISYEIKARGDTSNIEFISSVPKEYKFRQSIENYDISPAGPELFYSGDNCYAKFILNDLPESFFINIITDMTIYDFDLNAALALNNEFENSPGNAKKYLIDEKYIEKDDPAIIAIADSFENMDQIVNVKDIYDFVLSKMKYSGYNPSSAGALSALLSGSGDCTEYSDLFVALCRAKGIPARTVEGYTTDAAKDKIGLGHNWSEVYLDDYGWVPFDTIYDDNNGNSETTTFDNLKNIYIYTGYERNDKVLFDYHYYAYTYYGDNIEVFKRISVDNV